MDIKRFRVRQGDKSRFRGRRPDDTGPFDSKGAAEGHVRKGLERLQKRQELLYAQDRYALLLVFQGMDAAGKDSVIGHVMSGVSPQGTEVHSFKVPSFGGGAGSRLPVAGESAHCPPAGASASSTAPTMRRCSPCAGPPADSSTRRSFPRIGVTPPYLEGAVRGHQRVRALSLVRNGTVIRKFFPARLPRQAAEAACSSGLTIRPRTGSSPWGIFPSGQNGSRIWPPMRKSFGDEHGRGAVVRDSGRS